MNQILQVEMATVRMHPPADKPSEIKALDEVRAVLRHLRQDPRIIRQDGHIEFVVKSDAVEGLIALSERKGVTLFIPPRAASTVS